MLRSRAAHQVGNAAHARALELCGRDAVANVFVASRLEAGGPAAMTNVHTVTSRGPMDSFVWTSANVVPVAVAADEFDDYANKLKRMRRRSSSVFGPSHQVMPLWDRLERHWGEPRAVRLRQPLMSVTPSQVDTSVDAWPDVRPARPDELDLVVPAAAHMFTGEIGYPPYYGSDREYRRLLASIIERGHTFVAVHGNRVIFKADIGSLALGVAQIQGVWVAPELRGRGLAAPAMRAVVDHVHAHHAPIASLYVNDFNTPAVHAYERVGFRQVGEFSTVIL